MMELGTVEEGGHGVKGRGFFHVTQHLKIVVQVALLRYEPAFHRRHHQKIGHIVIQS